MKDARPDSPRFLIRSDRVMPGDVLLTHGPGRKSKLVAHFDGGKFSHAALFIASGVVFESDTDVTKISILQPFGAATEDTGAVGLYKVPDEQATAVAVYRHPLFNNVAAEFDRAVKTEITISFGKDYSRYYRLVRLAKLPTIIKAPAVWAFRLFETMVLKNKIPGPFCSELVARVYRRLRLPFFANNKSSLDVTPNDLAESELKPVADAVIDLKSDPDVVRTISLGDEPTIDFDTDALAENVRDIRLTDRQIKTLRRQMNAELHRVRTSQDGLLVSGFLQLIPPLKSLTRKIVAASTKNSLPSASAHRRRAKELWRTCNLLVPMFKRISDGEELAAGEWPEFLAHYTVFCKSLGYSLMLYESSRLKFESRQRRGWSTSLSHYRLKRKRAKILRQARRDSRHAFSAVQR